MRLVAAVDRVDRVVNGTLLHRRIAARRAAAVQQPRSLRSRSTRSRRYRRLPARGNRQRAPTATSSTTAATRVTDCLCMCASSLDPSSWEVAATGTTVAAGQCAGLHPVKRDAGPLDDAPAMTDNSRSHRAGGRSPWRLRTLSRCGKRSTGSASRSRSCASRRRLVQAADADRRLIEHHLHERVQQHLVALAVNLQLAHELTHADPPAAKALSSKRWGTTFSARWTRRHGLRSGSPPLLEAGGLAAAALGGGEHRHSCLRPSRNRSRRPTGGVANSLLLLP